MSNSGSITLGELVGKLDMCSTSNATAASDMAASVLRVSLNSTAQIPDCRICARRARGRLRDCAVNGAQQPV
jgi:hypothetical protein